MATSPLPEMPVYMSLSLSEPLPEVVKTSVEAEGIGPEIRLDSGRRAEDMTNSSMPNWKVWRYPKHLAIRGKTMHWKSSTEMNMYLY